MPKIEKSIIIVISITAILLFMAIVSLVIFQIQKEEGLPADDIKEEEKTENLLEELTSAKSEPLSQEEQEELDELLKQLTPVESKTATGEEQKEMEELLKNLTP